MAMSVSSKRITVLLAAIEEVIAHGPKTPDMKGNATTPQVADAICKNYFCVKVKPVYLNRVTDAAFFIRSLQ